MDNNQKFCTRCGKQLGQDVTFCPDCGLRVPGMAPEQVEQERGMVREILDSRLKWAAAMMLIYSIPFLILGVYIAVGVDGFVDELFTNPAYADYVDFYGLTPDEVTEICQYVSIMYVVSSICGIVSAVLCLKKRMYWVASIFCVLSFLLGCVGFFALFMGLGAFWLIMTSKLGFQEYSEKLDAELEKIN